MDSGNVKGRGDHESKKKSWNNTEKKLTKTRSTRGDTALVHGLNDIEVIPTLSLLPFPDDSKKMATTLYIASVFEVGSGKKGMTLV